MIKNSLLFFADKPELHDKLIGKIYKLNNLHVMRLKNFGVEQMRNFLVSKRNCIILFIIENSKDAAMSLLYRICNCSFSLPYIIAIFNNSTHRLINHVKVHESFKIFCIQSDDYDEDLVIDWINKVSNSLDKSIVFPRLKSYLMSSAKFKITVFLKNIGMFSYLTGYKYIVDAIELYINNQNLYITKDIYRILADRYKTNSMNIDRCMRHAIETVWKNTDINILKKYYYDDIDCDAGNKPSVFDFVRNCANKILFKKLASKIDEKIS